MGVTLSKTYAHIIPVDHWEKDDLGYCYMVDSLGRRWLSKRWEGTNRYSLYKKRDKKRGKIVRVMKQNNKFMEFMTYNTEEINEEDYIPGWTVGKDQIMSEYMFSDTSFAKDSEVIILETLLK